MESHSGSEDSNHLHETFVPPKIKWIEGGCQRYSSSLEQGKHCTKSNQSHPIILSNLQINSNFHSNMPNWNILRFLVGVLAITSTSSAFVPPSISTITSSTSSSISFSQILSPKSNPSMNNNLSSCQNNVNAKSSNEHDYQCVYTEVYVRIIQMRNCWFQHTQNSHFDSFIRCNIGRDVQDIRSSQKQEEDSGLASTLNRNQNRCNGEVPFSPKSKKVWSELEKVADSIKSSRITSDHTSLALLQFLLKL